MAPRSTLFTREDIVNAAFELVRKQGWEGFSVHAVAKAVGASTMPIYSQFTNVRDLEDAVCIRAFDLLKERMMEKVTGDVWLDQGITFIRFALEEKFLYRCLWDGRNQELQKQCGIDLWRFIDRELEGYPRFQGFSLQQFNMVRVARSLLAQGLATRVNTDVNVLQEKGISLEKFIVDSSLALLEGFKLQFEAEAAAAVENPPPEKGKE